MILANLMTRTHTLEQTYAAVNRSSHRFMAFVSPCDPASVTPYLASDEDGVHSRPATDRVQRWWRRAGRRRHRVRRQSAPMPPEESPPGPAHPHAEICGVGEELFPRCTQPHQVCKHCSSQCFDKAQRNNLPKVAILKFRTSQVTHRLCDTPQPCR